MRFLACLAALWAAALTWLGLYHPHGLRFSMGTWPVPPGTPWTYQLESGFVPALTVLTLLSAVVGAWRHVNCHQPGCWRSGRHRVNGTPWCDRHECNARPEKTDAELLESIDGKLSELLTLLRQA